jgi:hypothetical protein
VEFPFCFFRSVMPDSRQRGSIKKNQGWGCPINNVGHDR